MKQKAKLIFILLVTALFVIGCTQKQGVMKDKEQTAEDKIMEETAANEFDDELDPALEDLETIEEE